MDSTRRPRSGAAAFESVLQQRATTQDGVPAGPAALLAGWFKVLADPTRIRILSLLAQREMCVCDIAAALGMTQSAVSHQLRYLRTMRFVRNRRQGTTIYYTHDDAHTIGLLQMAKDHLLHVRAEEV